jgi:hypothetical protein
MSNIFPVIQDQKKNKSGIFFEKYCKDMKYSDLKEFIFYRFLSIHSLSAA